MAAVAWLMMKTHHGVEPDGEASNRQVFDQQLVYKPAKLVREQKRLGSQSTLKTELEYLVPRAPSHDIPE